jgi:predicted metal-binding membrane protein
MKSAVRATTGTTLLEFVLLRDRIIVMLAVAAVAALAWGYTVAGVGMDMTAVEMTAMAGMNPLLMAPTQWSLSYGLFVFLMWWIMMIAMMVPSAAPMVLLFAAIARKRQTQATPFIGTAAFLVGYLAVWASFSALAALLHWGLDFAGLLTPMMTASGGIFGGLLLIAAGLYQLTPLKRACLGQCREPIRFVSTHWRAGNRGAFHMGIVHGAYCLGCCWFLMGLLFFGGVMNLYWIAGIGLYVLAEKLVRRGHWLDYTAGTVLTVAGIMILLNAI